VRRLQPRALVDPALGLCGARPAAVAQVAARADRLRAVGAADRRIAAIVERVVREVVLTDVVPDVALGPVRERVQLPEVEPLVPAELRRFGTSAGVCPTDAGGPAVYGRKGLAHRLDLADAAAGIRVAVPQLRAVLGLLLVQGQVVEAVELDPQLLGEAVAGLVALLEEDVGVEVEEARLGVDLARQVRRNRARFLKRAGDVVAAAEVLEHPLHRLLRRALVELGGDRLVVEVRRCGDGARQGDGRWFHRCAGARAKSRTLPRPARPRTGLIDSSR